MVRTRTGGGLPILLAAACGVGALLVHVGVGREHQLLGEIGLVVADPLVFPVLDVLLLVADGLVDGVELGGDARPDGARRAAGRDEEGDEELPLGAGPLDPAGRRRVLEGNPSWVK